jgi:hypothetical protein
MLPGSPSAFSASTMMILSRSFITGIRSNPAVPPSKISTSSGTPAPDAASSFTM